MMVLMRKACPGRSTRINCRWHYPETQVFRDGHGEEDAPLLAQVVLVKGGGGGCGAQCLGQQSLHNVIKAQHPNIVLQSLHLCRSHMQQQCIPAW